jgi:predicted metal-binding membrane protein
MPMDMDMGMAQASLGALFAMWTAMMAIMMLPGAMPTVLQYVGAMTRTAFAVGYLAAWTGFSACVAALEWWLERSELLSENMVLRSSIAAGIIFVAVGVYQATPWKRHFLLQCRVRPPPQAGIRGAGGMGAGLRYGFACLGSSAALMALLFVVGVMSWPWILAIALWVLAEKLLPWGTGMARVGAIGLVGWGGWLLALSQV